MSDEHWKSCDKDTWMTPPEVLDRVREVNTISLDPCAPELLEYFFAEMNIRHGRMSHGYFGHGPGVPWDRLIEESPSEGLVFMNPPYGGRRRLIDAWIEKCAREAERGVEIIALVAASTGAQWFQWIWETAQAACFWKGRIKFLNPFTGEIEGSSTVWTVIPYWGHNVEGFLAAFDGAGELCVLNQTSEQALENAGLELGIQSESRGNGSDSLAEAHG